jgi:hypothetical protein
MGNVCLPRQLTIQDLVDMHERFSKKIHQQWIQLDSGIVDTPARGLALLALAYTTLAPAIT